MNHILSLYFEKKNVFMENNHDGSVKSQFPNSGL